MGCIARVVFPLSPFSHPLCGDLVVHPVSCDFHFPYSKTMYLNVLASFRVMLPWWCLLFFQPVFLNEVLVKLPTDPSSDEPVFHISHIDRVYTLKTDNINERWVVTMQVRAVTFEHGFRLYFQWGLWVQEQGLVFWLGNKLVWLIWVTCFLSFCSACAAALVMESRVTSTAPQCYSCIEYFRATKSSIPWDCSPILVSL